MSTEPAYRRLRVDERRRQILEAGAKLFASHSYDEISMRRIATTAGVSAPLLYHYFPSKDELFLAALNEAASELQGLIEPSGEGTAVEQLTASLDAYLSWIEQNGRTWSKLMQSAASLPAARELVDGFRERTMSLIVAELTDEAEPRAALRTALRGWLAFMDAAVLDWAETKDLTRGQLRDLLLAAFLGTLHAAQQADRGISLNT